MAFVESYIYVLRDGVSIFNTYYAEQNSGVLEILEGLPSFDEYVPDVDQKMDQLLYPYFERIIPYTECDVSFGQTVQILQDLD